MPRPIVLFVKYVDRLNHFVGRLAMYLFFVLAAVLLWSTFSRLAFGVPVNWALEMSQFILSAYYLLGGAYAMQLNGARAHGSVLQPLNARKRGRPPTRSRSSSYSFIWASCSGVVCRAPTTPSSTSRRTTSAWAPVLWPVKVVMTIGIFLMLLQCISNFFKDIADGARKADRMSSELITLFMFATMMVLLITGQRVFGVIGFVGAPAALLLWGKGGFEMPFNAAFQVLNWYPLITVPFFIFMGFMLSEMRHRQRTSTGCSTSGSGRCAAGWRSARSA